jgi:hypothetical protein
MWWLLDEPSAYGQVVEYDALLKELFRRTRAEAMCLDDRQRLPSHLLAAAMATRSSPVVGHVHKPNRFFRTHDAPPPPQPDGVVRNIADFRRQN